jgi:Domain of unknown function (DUF5655)
MQTRDWRQHTEWIADLLSRRTGQDLDAWNERIAAQGFADEASLRGWLSGQGVDGYPQLLLVMERFGYPDFLRASADELIDSQYTDRPGLRPILDAILTRAAGLGEMTIQARKGYISLLTPKRTFAAVQPTSRTRVDLGLKLKRPQLRGRFAANSAMGSSVVNSRIPLSSVDEVDDEIEGWLRQAYADNS